jgi:hypothetical protein
LYNFNIKIKNKKTKMENQAPAPKSSKKGCYIAVIVCIFLFSWMIFPWISPGSILMLKDYLSGSNRDAEEQKQLEEIVKSAQPAPARNYQFHNPSKEALNRTIDCKKLAAFQNSLPAITPACLNLYRTSPNEINKKMAEKKYDRIIVYGENIIFDAPAAKDPKYPDWDLGKATYDSAKFDDQIAIPALLKLYGLADLSFVNKLTPDKVYPFPAIYYRVGTDPEVQKVCGTQDQSEFAGCAIGMWAIMVSEKSLGEHLSLANQKIWRNTGEQQPDYLAFDYKWPENCYTDGVLIHETAHVLLYSLRTDNPSDALVATRYFNEHQADFVAILGTNLVCGENTVSNFRTRDKKPMSIPQFNSIYPPTKMGSFSPDPKEGCQLAILNEWNRFMAKGNFETQFGSFITNLKSWMKAGKTINNDKGFEDFVIQLNNDSETQNNLQYHGCPY